MEAAGEFGDDSHFAWSMGKIILENICGVFVGVSVGMLGWLFKFISNWRFNMQLKCFYSVVMAFAFVIASELSTFKNSKYLACLSFGYVSFRLWGANGRPSAQLAVCWYFIQPFLFGTIGAALLFN
jgi:NhaP-type Na+/H+ or K+/H+ antiporter